MFPLLRWAATLAVLAVVTASCASPQGEVQACEGDEITLRTEGVLRVGVDMDFPPFAFRDDEGGATGFEIEILRELSERLDLDLLLLPRGSSALLPAVMAHSLDLAASGIRDDPDLIRDVCLTLPYLDGGLGVLVPVPDPRDIRNLGDLAGRTVAVRDGSRAAAWARDNLPASPIVDVPTREDLVTSLDTRSANAAVGDLAYLRYMAGRSPAHAVVHEIDIDRSYVFAAAHDNGPLVGEINRILEELEEEAWLEDLRREWFGA